MHPPGLPHRPRRGVRGLCALEPGITLSAIAEPDGALAEKTLRHLTDIDHHHHEAIVALDEPDDAGIGVARFVRDPMRSDTAEVAVTVVDEWQRRGVSTMLLNGVSVRAWHEGSAPSRR